MLLKLFFFPSADTTYGNRSGDWYQFDDESVCPISNEDIVVCGRVIGNTWIKCLPCNRFHSSQLHAIFHFKEISMTADTSHCCVIQPWLSHRENSQLNHREYKAYTLVAKAAISFDCNCMCAHTTTTITMHCLHFRVSYDEAVHYSIAKSVLYVVFWSPAC